MSELTHEQIRALSVDTVRDLIRHQAEDQRAILALRASARAQCYTAAQHDVATAIEHQHQKAIDRAVMDNIQRAREGT